MKFFLFPLLFMALISLSSVKANEESLIINPQTAKLSWGPCPPIFPKTCEVAVLHGDPVKENADILIKAPSGAKFVPHTHTSAERMILLSGVMEVKYKGQAKKILKKGDYAYGPAKLPHEAQCIKGPCKLFVAFEASVDAEAYTESLD